MKCVLAETYCLINLASVSAIAANHFVYASNNSYDDKRVYSAKHLSECCFVSWQKNRTIDVKDDTPDLAHFYGIGVFVCVV